MTKTAGKQYSGDEMKRYLGSLKEHFTDGVKAIGEKVDFLSEKMDRKFEQVDAKLDSHTEMIGKIMLDIEIIKSDIQIIKTDVKRKVDYEEFSKLEKRVHLIEARFRH
ncbi:MAG: hypothetical protein HYT46_00450 [Candidatus Vogelbacteria bacterium]|nr:hypothetical protein [Candidatus Vogelbacteria bacterium]